MGNKKILLTEAQHRQFLLMQEHGPDVAKNYLKSIADFQSGRTYPSGCSYRSRSYSTSLAQITEIIELRQAEETYKEISSKTGVPLTTVSRVCRHYGLSGRDLKIKQRRAKDLEILDLYKAGLTYAEIKTRLKVSMTTISRALRQGGVSCRMSPEVIQEAHRLKKQGIPLEEIGDRLGFHHTTICKKLKEFRRQLREAKPYESPRVL